jgi:hypothetical protein
MPARVTEHRLQAESSALMHMQETKYKSCRTATLITTEWPPIDGKMSTRFGDMWLTSCGMSHYMLNVLVCGVFLFGLAPVQATDETSSLTNTPYATAAVGNATKTIAFSSAVQHAASVSWELNQLTSKPALPIPTNITEYPEYEIVSKLAPAMPPVQAGVTFPEADSMIDDLIRFTNVSNTGSSLTGRTRRQGALRVMVVGDSMSQGKTLRLTVFES